MTGRLLSGVAALGAEPDRAAPTPAVSAEEVTGYLSDLAESLRMMDELVATTRPTTPAIQGVGGRGREHRVRVGQRVDRLNDDRGIDTGAIDLGARGRPA